MPRIRMVLQLINAGNGSHPHRIQVDVPDKFQKIRFFFDNNTFVAVLKEVTLTLMAKVEPHCVTSQKAAHNRGQVGSKGLN